jgi:hypothetical protein
MMAHFEQLERLLLDEILIFANLIQIPAVILTGGVAWLVCRPIRRWVTDWVERVPEHHHLDWIVSHRSWVTDRLVPLITPTAWAIGLWISVSVAQRAGWPHAVTQTAVSLLLAWLVIRLAAALVPYAALARCRPDHRAHGLTIGDVADHQPQQTWPPHVPCIILPSTLAQTISP